MALHLTPKLLELTYELLRATPPFNRWKLPHADEVEFHVMRPRDRKLMADYNWWIVDGKFTLHRIRIAANSDHRTIQMLSASMAHEMVHMRQRALNINYASHGKVFKDLARQVCRTHRFDFATF